jgi:hypothetical protein
MKLLPSLGVDELRFGDSASKCIVIIGEPAERRTHSSEQRTSLYYQSLALGFGSDDRLDFIVVHDGGQAELWGERPFDIARRSLDAYAELKQWLESSGRIPQTHQDCFGATLSVHEEGVTFCFEAPDSMRLEGIQLYPR